MTTRSGSPGPTGPSSYGQRFPGKCWWCKKPMTFQRVTFPRAKTGDIVICSFDCVWEWDDDRREEALLETIVEE